MLIAASPAWAQKGGRRPTSAPSPKSQPAEETKAPPAETVRTLLLEPAEWAPADALCYLGIDDVVDTVADIQKTSAFALLSSPLAAGTVPGLDLSAVVTDLKARLGKALDIPPDQLQNPFAGPLAIFFTAPFGAKLDELEPGLVAGVGDAVLMKKYYTAAVTKLSTLGKHDSVTIGGDTIDVFTIERAKKSSAGGSEDEEFAQLDAGKAPKLTAPDEMLKKLFEQLLTPESLPRTLALCLTADRVIVAASADHVEALVRRDESAKTLAATDDYKSMLQYLKPVGSIRFLVNLPRIVEMAPAAGDSSRARQLRKQIKTYGLDNVGSLVGSCRLGAASYEWKIETLLLLDKAGAADTGLLRLLHAENRPIAPPADTSADACVYAAWNLDLPLWLDELEHGIFRSEEDRASGTSWLEQRLPSGETVNLRRAFFDYLEGPLTITFGLSRTPAPAGARLLASIRHHDQSAVTKFFQGPLLEDKLQPRELRGMQLFDVAPLPMLPVSGLAAAVTPDRVVVGNTAAVEDALAPMSTDALANTEAWKHAARYVPTQGWLTLYSDNRKLLDDLADLAKNPPEPAGGDLGSVVLAILMQSMGGDASTLERARRYSTQSIYTLATTPQGIELTAVQLRPEK
jgi:hypothetical protein